MKEKLLYVLFVAESVPTIILSVLQLLVLAIVQVHPLTALVISAVGGVGGASYVDFIYTDRSQRMPDYIWLAYLLSISLSIGVYVIIFALRLCMH